MNKGENLLILMSDEHARRVLGCYGEDRVGTPNLDALARDGTRFTTAYTPSPICVPARAALATGLPVHQTGNWDNAHPYDGNPSSWGHALQRIGRRVESIGKLHYRDNTSPTGFDRQTIPMHVANGVGDVTGSIRDVLPVRTQSRNLAENLGPGETEYTRYDRAVRDKAIAWLKRAAQTAHQTGWTLMVSFVAPHFPLIAPEEFYRPYREIDLAPRKPEPDEVGSHPWVEALRRSYVYDNFDAPRRREALRSYFGLVSFLDDNIGQILATLEDTGLAHSTTVIYFSDHGDNLGERGLWGKSTFFEDSVGVPLIVRMPGPAIRSLCSTPVSLLDVYPTVLDHAGIDWRDSGRPGASLFEVASRPDEPERTVLSEYHAAGSPAAGFMLRAGNYKLIHYVGYAPQLFDVEADPFERHDLANVPGYDKIVEEYQVRLLAELDPTAVDKRAKKDQSRLVAIRGGRERLLEAGGLVATPVPTDFG